MMPGNLEVATMVKIVGNLTPEDDYTHPLGPEENFNESVYFNFFDPKLRMGGFVRMGNRPNEGYAEMTITLYLPDGGALFQYKRPKIDDNDGWNAGGLEVEIVEPGERIRTRYEGKAVYLADPRAMQDPGSAFKNSPHKDLTIDLLHEGVGPIYGRIADPAEGENDFARAHYEQHMRVSGSVEIEDGRKFAVAGNGLRDHSWGPRYWQSTPSYRWITGNYGDDLGMVISIVGDRIGGVFQKGDEVVDVVGVELDTAYESGTNYHESLKAVLILANGEEHIVEGKVVGFIPLRNRRAGRITQIGEGMTEYTLDGDRVGYGLSEYLDQTS
jgi:hypothetical protein